MDDIVLHDAHQSYPRFTYAAACSRVLARIGPPVEARRSFTTLIAVPGSPAKMWSAAAMSASDTSSTS